MRKHWLSRRHFASIHVLLHEENPFAVEGAYQNRTCTQRFQGTGTGPKRRVSAPAQFDENAEAHRKGRGASGLHKPGCKGSRRKRCQVVDAIVHVASNLSSRVHFVFGLRDVEGDSLKPW